MVTIDSAPRRGGPAITGSDERRRQLALNQSQLSLDDSIFAAVVVLQDTFTDTYDFQG
jgi:hypothetical protein